MLNAEELERYARHIVLREVGGPGQQALKRARVLVIGAGGLGAPVLLYLAAAGVGTLGVIDDDKVALSNLQRQVIHGTPEIGEPKIASAAARSVGSIRTLRWSFMARGWSPAMRLRSSANTISSPTDRTISPRAILVSDACFFARRPLITAAVGTFDGTLTTIRAHERAADGSPHPTYRCLFPEPPPAGSVPACAEAGILGALTGVRRLADGARGDPRDRRIRRGFGRAAADARLPAPCGSRRCPIPGIRPIRSRANGRRSEICRRTSNQNKLHLEERSVGALTPVARPLLRTLKNFEFVLPKCFRGGGGYPPSDLILGLEAMPPAHAFRRRNLAPEVHSKGLRL